MRHTHILIIEDDPFQSAILERMLLKQSDYIITRISNGKESLEFIKQDHTISLIFLDIGLPDIDGIALLEKIKQSNPTLPVIILTSSEHISDAVTTIKKGAIDYLSKPPEKERIMVAVRNALKIYSLSEEISHLKRTTNNQTVFADLIGYDQGLRHIIGVSKKAAESDISVLITGETGVGKELFARAIHGESSRHDKPFIAVNCGAIPNQLVESTLFGHEKGSFTGAISKNIGKFREANGGTIFLDEIGELPLNIQVSLLRTLQQNEVEPVGANKLHPINVRIISATHRSLPDEIQQGNFRQDLFFRLYGLPIKIPPLRDRIQDLPHLVDYFIKKFTLQDNISPKTLSPDALHRLNHYHWPGNIRELKNLMHRVLILTDNEFISDSDIHSVMMPQSTISDNNSPTNRNNLTVIDAKGEVRSLSDIEQQAFQIVMQYYDNNISKAHRSLGIAKSTFYRKWNTIKSKDLF